MARCEIGKREGPLMLCPYNTNSWQCRGPKWVYIKDGARRGETDEGIEQKRITL